MIVKLDFMVYIHLYKNGISEKCVESISEKICYYSNEGCQLKSFSILILIKWFKIRNPSPLKKNSIPSIIHFPHVCFK